MGPHSRPIQVAASASLPSASANRKAGVLRVDAIHQDVPLDRTMTAAVDGEIKDLAHWLELDLTLPH